VVKAVGLFGLLLLLWLLGYSKIASAPTEAAPAAMAGSGELPAGFSVHAFLHHTRDEHVSVHAMAGIRACPE
jgi:hypothetical protein